MKLLTVFNLSTAVYLDVASFNPVESHRRFRGT